MEKADAKLLLEQFNATVKGSMTRDYYVYVYKDKKGVPFYVGIGSRSLNGHTYHRCYQHLNNARKGMASHLCRKIRKMQKLKEPIVIQIVRCSDSRSRVCALEKELILDYGQINEGGVLCNVADGGDGGVTIKKGSRKITDGTTAKILRPGDSMPKGWTYGEPDRARPNITCYCPETGRRTRVYTVSDIPKGWIQGAPSGVATGPKGKQIWHNPKTGKMFWLTDRESKVGLARGRGTSGSTLGKVAVCCEKTGETRFIQEGARVPRGFRLGQLSKPSTIKGTKVYHDSQTKKIFYIPQGEKVPKGLLEGRPDRELTPWAWYHNPKAGKSVQVPLEEDPPKGYVKGLPKKHSAAYSKRCEYKGKIYASVADCMSSVGESRYKLLRHPDFRLL